MVRYTVFDPEKVVSFPGDAELAHHLTAACASEPRLLEDLLLGVETYRRGEVERVMHGLLHYDAQRQRNECTEVGEIFEVTDKRTREAASSVEQDGLVVFDLASKNISALGFPGRALRARGRMISRVPSSNIERETLYALTDEWSVVEAGRAQMGSRSSAPALSATVKSNGTREVNHGLA
jgi:hypothetical protein